MDKQRVGRHRAHETKEYRREEQREKEGTWGEAVRHGGKTYRQTGISISIF